MATIIIQNCLYSPGHGVCQSFIGSHWNALPLLHDDVRSWQIFETLHRSTFRLRIPRRCSTGFKSGDILGQAITFTLNLFSKAMVVLEVCLGSLSCRNTALLPSFWREGIMLCSSISQYMLEFMFPSMKYNSPTPAALMQP